MNRQQQSREHHWWPVSLQKYWTDKNGDVWWIDPDGKIGRKRALRRKLARKAHGHTLLRNTVWETNFEREFESADDRVPYLIDTLNKFTPPRHTLHEFIRLLRLMFKKDRHLRDICKYYQMDDKIHRSLLLLILSLLIRSPGSRAKYENYPSMIGLPPDDEVGKANMRTAYTTARHLIEKTSTRNHFFVLIKSYSNKTFICGDGHLDWITGSLSANRIDGKALLPLTPKLCVFVCTPRSMRDNFNCASLTAAPWMVDWINDITQIYSRDQLFFVGKRPSLHENFRSRKFLEHTKRADEFIDTLNELPNTWPDRSIFFPI